MAESKVLTTDELSKLQEFRNKDNQLVFNLGQTELQIQGLEEQKDQILEAAKQLAAERNEFGQTLTEKYGSGTINIETGEISAAE